MVDLPQKIEIKHQKLYKLLCKVFKPKTICKIYDHDENVDWSSWSDIVAHNYISTCKRCGEKWILKEKFMPEAVRNKFYGSND